MAKILFCAVDGGASEALAPVASLLRIRGHHVRFVAQTDSIASTKFTDDANHIDDSNESIRQVLRTTKPDVVVAGVSGNGPDLVLHLSQVAKEAGIPVVKVLDFWGTGMPHEKNFAPDRICVLDEASCVFEATMRGMPLTHVIPTGSPVFDGLVGTALPYGVFHSDILDNEFVLFVGPSNEGRVREVFDIILPVLQEAIRPVRLGVLLHPKSKPETYAGDLMKRLATDKSLQFVDDQNLRRIGSEDELLASADLVVGTTSSLLVKACYLRRPVLSIVPQGGLNHRVLKERGMEQMPTSARGASFHAENQDDVRDFLRGFVLSGDRHSWDRIRASLERSQRANYKLDGLNANRVAGVIESLV